MNFGVKLTVAAGVYTLVFELRPFQWHLFGKRHSAGWGVVCGPVGLGYLNAELALRSRLGAIKDELSNFGRGPNRAEHGRAPTQR